MIITKKVYELADEGVHNAQITKTEDLGQVESPQYGTQHRAAIYFSMLDQTDKEGDAIEVRYNVNCVTGPKSRLGQMLAALKVETGDTFDTDNLLGLKCQVVIQHNVSEQNNTTYANIVSFVPLRKTAVAEV